MSTVYKTETYSILHCSSCGVGFGLESSFRERRLSDRKSFYCPWGHSQWFPGKTDAQIVSELKAQIATKNDLLASTQREVDKRYRLQRAAEGKTRAIKRRVAHGVCPCCTRSFQNLAQHMANKHPGFSGTDGDQQP